MVASKTSLVIAAVVLGAISSVYAAPTPFNARSDLASRSFEDADFLEARFFNDEAELEVRDFEDTEEIFARDFFDDEQDLFARDNDDSDGDNYHEAPPRTGLSRHPSKHLYDDERHPGQHRGQHHSHGPPHSHHSQRHPHANSMTNSVKLHARTGPAIRPLHDRVVVKKLEVEHKTKGGIIIPDTAKEKPQEGEILAVGHGKTHKLHARNGLVIRDRVIVKAIGGEHKTKGGIVIPDTTKEKPQQGQILSVGHGHGK